MMAVHHRPDLVTPALRMWLREFVRYDDDGRSSCWFNRDATPLESVAKAVAPGVAFESVLLQAYRDGRAVTPCHSDPGGGFILSLGAPRTFRVHRGRCDAAQDVLTIQCTEGTVILWDEDFNRGWHHQLVADPGITEEKLSLVFRTRPGG